MEQVSQLFCGLLSDLSSLSFRTFVAAHREINARAGGASTVKRRSNKGPSERGQKYSGEDSGSGGRQGLACQLEGAFALCCCSENSSFHLHTDLIEPSSPELALT